MQGLVWFETYVNSHRGPHSIEKEETKERAIDSFVYYIRSSLHCHRKWGDFNIDPIYTVSTEIALKLDFLKTIELYSLSYLG